MVHDEIVCIIRDDHTEQAARLLKDAMENNWVTEKIDIPMIAQPVIGKSFAEAKD
jgi:DNA polymerase I-like protein with 3'-5' exonuclease and polymerase domains